ncbi:MAG: NAD(P)/FAD-dependent oxidoreductase [Phycisphaerales bacterium]|nr:NAD(P)/FAD-dependent oxidoreductase [Phycisphaerales bacterium]MCB9835243.1 NAD(P)/FAD-dependent oxidoreductase [Phycisphaera sp.]
MAQRVDIAIVGAGAAGLMTAIHAGRGLIGSGKRVLVLDGASTIGVKILVAGGGRCNVTHHEVDEKQYAGGSRNTIKKVLRRFDVPETIAFFKELGVELKRENTGKLFPTTDRAQTVLDAMLREIDRVGVEIRNPWRVGKVEKQGDTFVLSRQNSDESIEAARVVLATGGMALPKSGSDGGGYALATSLGHTLTKHRFPALVPLVVGDRGQWLTELSGISARAAVEVRAGSGKRLARYENDLLLTHFGLSGPAVMDASRWLTEARFADPGAHLRIAWLIGETFESVEKSLMSLGTRRVVHWVRERLPERLALALCAQAGVHEQATGATLTKDARRALAHALVEMPVDIARDRGFTHAEATAGGVTLSEIDPGTMQSRVCPGLFLVGETLDVDGRIGGFNFQWAWATGVVGGQAAIVCV